MTILNVYVSPERALVGVDTPMNRNGQRVHVSKFQILPHANAVLSGRGHLPFIAGLYRRLLLRGGDFDELSDAMAALFADAFAEWLKLASAVNLASSTPIDEQEIVFVGYSTGSNRIVGREYNQNVRRRGFSSGEINPRGYISAGNHESIARLPEPSTKERMIQLAHAQTALFRREALGIGVGGRLILCEITRGGIKIESVADLDSEPAELPIFIAGNASRPLTGAESSAPTIASSQSTEQFKPWGRQ